MPTLLPCALRRRPARSLGAIALGALLVGGGALPAAAAPAQAAPTEHTTLGLTGDDVMAHLAELDRVTNLYAADGYRVWNGPGYEAAAEYIETALLATGAFTVERQPFEVESEVEGPIDLTSAGAPVTGTEHLANANGTTAPVVDAPIALPVAADSTNLGCDPADYAAVPPAAIVLVERGVCTFEQKVLLASASGAAAVLIFNNADGFIGGQVGLRNPANAPAAGLSRASGIALRDAVAAAALAGTPAPTASLSIEKAIETETTFNVIAETTAGDPEDVLVIGAHLDGVAEGPAANDNASGSAALLALADRIAAAETPNDSRIRLTFWGAEEIGLLGSTHYVSDLLLTDPAELERISAYLNYDMIGSENYTVGVYDADASEFESPIPPTPESIALEAIYTGYFDRVGQPWVDSDFSGRSDYAAFLLAGIPSGGLFSGADEIKTAEEVALFGGVAGVPLDRNYHSPTDTLANVSREAVDIFAPAIGFATHTLAWELAVPPVVPPVAPEPLPQPPAPVPAPPVVGEPVPAANTPVTVPVRRTAERDGTSSLAQTGSDLLLPLAIGTALLLLTGGTAASIAATRARRAR